MSDYLCEELIDEILERLPPKSLLRFRSVSKSWYCRISSLNFIHKHTIRSLTTRACKKIRNRVRTCYNRELWAYVDWSDAYTRSELAKFNESKHIITGICSGIICMGTRTLQNPSAVFLWNPSVRRKLTIPDYPCSHFGVSFGFGFDPINDDYKIVGFCEHISFVYSIKTSSWSEIQVPTTCRFSEVRSYGYFANGALHWVVLSEINNIAHSYILTFNLSTHVFGMISLPNPNCRSNKLTCIKYSLALISSDGYERWVWIRSEENDNVASAWSNAANSKSLKVEHCQGYNPFTGVHYALEVDSYNRYTIKMDICVETLELLDKEPC